MKTSKYLNLQINAEKQMSVMKGDGMYISIMIKNRVNNFILYIGNKYMWLKSRLVQYKTIC